VRPPPTGNDAANQRLIAEFVAQADVTDSTRAKYRAHLGELARWLASESGVGFEQVSSIDLVRFMAYLRSGDRFAAPKHHRVIGELSASARKNVIASIHSFYRYLVLVGIVAVDPSASIKPPRVAHRSGLVLDVDEVRALLEARGGTPRERIQTYLLAYTAARSHELRQLRWSDIDMATATMTLLGKGGKRRVIDVHPVLMGELRRWYICQSDEAARNAALRSAKSDPATDFVLLTRTGRQVAKTVIAEQLKRRAIRAGVRVRPTPSGTIATNVSPHAMRRTFATILLDEGHHIDAIADVLGHSSIDTTRKHYAFASNARRRATILAYDPLAGQARDSGHSRT
jgi:site-specific recombinase XerD